MDSFAVAGKDREWHWAKAKIDGGSIILGSSKVNKPVAARYAWGMNPSQRNLSTIRKDSLLSFRTDDWPLYDPKAELVEVTKPTKPKAYQSKDWSRPSIQELNF